MNKIMMILMIAVGASSVAYGQTKMTTDSKVEAQIIALEKQAWQEWSNKNTSFVQNYLADDAFYVYADGVVDKAQIVKSIPTCDLKNFSLDNFTFRMLDKNSALLNYTAAQEAFCYGKKQAANIRVNSVYVRRGGKWLNLSYMETVMPAANGSMQKEKPETFSLRPAVEKEYGYIHAMRIGDDLKISGAVSMDDKGILVAPGNLEQQMKNCYGDLEKILKHYGYSFDDVTVENVFTTDMAEFINVSGYRNSIYKNGFPTGTWLEVKGLALPGQLIEIDMEAHKAK
ncbi:MAG: Rid family hydrolase [Acidobacteriota bacterium]